MKEVWRPIPSLPTHLASSEGGIMRVPYTQGIPNGGVRCYGGEPVIGQWDGTRYVYAFGGKNYKVARLVCEAFGGLPPDGAVCMHLDENSRNNRRENLRWGTQKENLNAPGFIAYCQSRTGDRSPIIKGMQHRAQAASRDQVTE